MANSNNVYATVQPLQGNVAEVKNIDCNDEKFGFRTGMRIAMIQTICEDELNLK